MKTAISLPDELFERGEQAARRLGLNRSELYARALDKFLTGEGPDPVTESLNAHADEYNNDAEVIALLEASNAHARRLIERGDWEW